MTRQNWPLRFVLWFVAPFDDRLRGFSLTRVLAIACFVLVAHEVFVHEKGLTWIDFWTLTLGVCTAYGKKMVYAFLQRIGLKSESKDITEKVEITVKGRENGDFQATP